MARSAIPLWRDKTGITSVEYGLLAALIMLAIITSVQTLGTSVSDVYLRLTAAL